MRLGWGVARFRGRDGGPGARTQASFIAGYGRCRGRRHGPPGAFREHSVNPSSISYGKGEPVVPEMELQDAAVGDRMEGLVAQVPVEGAHRPAVVHEEDPAPPVVPGDPLDGGQDAR